MSATTKVLPEGYRLHETINLQKDKKTALLLNLLAIAIMLVMLFIGYRIQPFHSLDTEISLRLYWIRTGSLLLGIVLYMVLHELVHGIFMRTFSGVRPHYGFTGLYAYAGSEVYFNKRHYVIIALAPLVIWGVVLAVLTAIVQSEWFWVAYFIQIANISGAAGDLYVFWKFSRLPDEILIQDTGIEMGVFVPPSDENVL